MPGPARSLERSDRRLERVLFSFRSQRLRRYHSTRWVGPFQTGRVSVDLEPGKRRLTLRAT